MYRNVCNLLSTRPNNFYPSAIKKPLIRWLTFLLFLFDVGIADAQINVWVENFSGANQGWNTDFTDCDGLPPGFAGVNGGRFEARGQEGSPCCPLPPNGNVSGGNYNEWVTNPINIGSYCRVNISVDYGTAGSNPFECSPGGPYTGVACNGTGQNPINQSHDQMVFEYSLDGGPWIQFGYVCGAGAGTNGA